jgi:hypothetical protein
LVRLTTIPTQLIPDPPVWKTKFTKKQKRMLRPIAEVLAMLDGNAFFGTTKDRNGEDTWYEKYLPQAWELFKNNGGEKGWAGAASWIQDDPTRHKNPVVREAYNQWQVLKALVK